MTQKELGYVELEWTCKYCGTINPGMKRVCTNCGAPISQDDKFEMPDQQELITDKAKLEEAKSGPAIQCPYCNVLNPAGTKFCVQCGGDIQAGLARQAGEVLGAYETAAVPDKPCPSCGQLVKANALRCPYCGGSLVAESAKPAVSSGSMPKKTSIWMIIGGIAVVLLCVGSLIAYLILSNRTNEVTATVSEFSWKLSIDILEKQPVQKSAWSDQVPLQAQEVTCRDEYKETRDVPAPNATEVCGTPYTIDVGSGAGKVVQDCEYHIYASYCNFTVLDWFVVDTAVAYGDDNIPSWPVTSLKENQQAGDRHESYQIIFDANPGAYTYTPVDMAEFKQFDLGSEWVLDVNSFGQIKDMQRK